MNQPSYAAFCNLHAISTLHVRAACASPCGTGAPLRPVRARDAPTASHRSVGASFRERCPHVASFSSRLGSPRPSSPRRKVLRVAGQVAYRAFQRFDCGSGSPGYLRNLSILIRDGRKKCDEAPQFILRFACSFLAITARRSSKGTGPMRAAARDRCRPHRWALMQESRYRSAGSRLLAAIAAIGGL